MRIHLAIDWLSILTVLAWIVAIIVCLIFVRQLLKPKPRIPWKLGPRTIDLRGGRDTLHTVIGGMSGTGKSSVVQDLLLRADRALVIAFDNSRPIRELYEAMGWTVWKPDGSLGWDILQGSPQIVSEALTAGFARTSADTGYNRGLARMRLWRALDALDHSGVPRDIWLLIKALRMPGSDADETRACRSWANRFESIAMSLGPALGRDIELAEAMRRSEKVLMLPNRFLSPEDAPLVGAIALVQARRVAQEVGGFVLVVEEAGQAGARLAEMVPLWQAARDRGVPSVLITQNMAKLPDEIVNNTSIWISFAQESHRETMFAVERMRHVPDPETDFDREVLPTGWCWLRAPDTWPQRVRVALPKLPKVPDLSPGEVGSSAGAENRWVQDDTQADVFEVDYSVLEEAAAMDGWQPEPLALRAGVREPEPVPNWLARADAAYIGMWGQCSRTHTPAILWRPGGEPWIDERGCLVWHGGWVRKPGVPPRPRKVVNGKDVTPYREFWRLKHGTYPEPTFDHWCDNPACCDPDHGEACGIGENNARNPLRRAAFESAGWTKHDGVWAACNGRVPAVAAD